jgi:putative transposase
LSVLQWVESAPVREGLVDKAMDWPYSSLARTKLAIATPRPTGWVRAVNGNMDAPTLANLALCLKRNRPFGDEGWVKMTAEKLGLNHTLNAIGRPRKTVAA